MEKDMNDLTQGVGPDYTKEQRKLQKRMAERLLDASDDKVNRNIKDSVVCDLFGRPEYLM